MKMLEWIMHVLPRHHCKMPPAGVPGSDPIRDSIRKAVHSHRNIAANAVHESRQGAKVAHRSLRVAEEAIERLEQARVETEKEIKDGPSSNA